MGEYYTYAWLREDGRPFYIGKGRGDRAYTTHISKRGRKYNPPPKERILILKENLDENSAFKHEKYLIWVLGRKDIGTGILVNKSDGGEGSSGWVMSDDHKRTISETHKNKVLSEETKNKLRSTRLERNCPIPTNKGRIWWNNGTTNLLVFECPGPEWTKGQIRDKTKQQTKEYREKRSNLIRGRKWWNNGEEEKLSLTPPPGNWSLGRLKTPNK
jgi:hypothetical protein